MCQTFTRRQLLRRGGVFATVVTAGCLEGTVESRHQTLRTEQPTRITLAETDQSSRVQESWQTNLNLNATELWFHEAISHATEGVTLAGSADGQPLLLRLSGDGDSVWTHIVDTGETKAAFESLSKTSTGGLVAAGWKEWNGFVARFTSTGELVWQRTLAPGPDNYQFKEIRQQDGNRLLGIGERTGKGDGAHRDSAWLVSITEDGRIDWHRFYGEEISSVDDVSLPSRNTCLLTVWKQTSGWRQDGDFIARNFDSITAIDNGLKAWEHVYPGADIDTVGVTSRNHYYFSATGDSGSQFRLPDSIALFGYRRFGKEPSWLQKLTFDGQEVAESLSIPVNEEWLAVWNLAESPPIATRISRDGTLGESFSVDIAAEYILQVSSQSLLFVSERDRITKVNIGENA